MNRLRFVDKTVVVTGAGSGMGRTAAIRLASEGAKVMLLGRQAGMLEEVRDEIKRADGLSYVFPCDIRSQSQVEKTFTAVASVCGQVDALFANAGYLGAFKPLAEADIADFSEPLETNLNGTFLTIRHCLPLIKKGAILINASWTTGSVMPGAGIYAATKAALLAIMRTLAVECGPRGIRVNAVSPGVILTPMAASALPEATVNALASRSLLQRNGVPEDISGTVAWLLSDDASYVTGQEIMVDGGFTIGGMR
ncbi:alcohol dehydrogenase [Kosakonia radicincitans]|uniref:SDR family NAD(P)-dependent oxidoreductase n=1 Tax=Kosakonia radicincitans TaxID=283686 RepID=UPI000903C9A0|nr:SDR family oxidoreductase [Kosakonia radicincitans]APG19889.1 alcohol dehydrogenase [Kosakonia radicincitans]